MCSRDKDRKDFRNFRRNLEHRIERKWEEISQILEKMENVRINLQIDPQVIREQKKTQTFFFKGQQKLIISSLSPINFGHVFRIAQGDDREILKTIKTGHGMREANMLGNLHHKNIMRMIGLETKYELDFLILSDCGKDMRSIMDQVRAVDFERLKGWAINFFDALVYSHRK